MALEMEHVADEFDISDLDRVDAVLSCGHKIRVHRERIGEKQPCARCEIETGTLIWATIGLDGPLPPARRGYRPPRRNGFVSEFHVSDALRRAWIPEKIDTRTATEKIEEAQRVAAERERQRQARYDAGFDLIRSLVAESATGRVTRAEYDAARGDLPSPEALVKNLGRSWSQLVREAGGTPACSRGRAAVQVTPALLEASAKAAHEMAAARGKRPDKTEWDSKRPEGLPSRPALVAATGTGTWGGWLASIGLPFVPNVNVTADRKKEMRERRAKKVREYRAAAVARAEGWVREWAESHGGRAPTQRQYRNGTKGKGYPAHTSLRDWLGVEWSEWVASFGFEAPQRFDISSFKRVSTWNRDEPACRAAIIELAGRLGRTPSSTDWDRLRPDGVRSFISIRRSSGLSWAEWVASCGLPPVVPHRGVKCDSVREAA